MSKNIESQLNVGSNEYVVAAALITFHVNDIGEYDKQDIVTNI